LLLGLRQPTAWTAIRPRAFEASFASLRRAYRVVICDIDDDLEDETAGGSADVEERNVMSRTASSQADVVMVVGSPGMKGLHSLSRLIEELAASGVRHRRIVPIINRSPRKPGARSELSSTLASLFDRGGKVGEIPSALFLPERRVDEALHDGVRLPDAIGQPLAEAFDAVLRREDGSRPIAKRGELVKPGSIGRWSGREAALG
ncbi:MAG: hypothetical protein ACRD1G_16180, partial [Acidimicrobiales bacterium]